MNDPMDSNAFYVGMTRSSISHEIKSLKGFACTDHAEIVLDCIENLIDSLSDCDFDTSEDSDKEGYYDNREFMEGWRVYGFNE